MTPDGDRADHDENLFRVAMDAMADLVTIQSAVRADDGGIVDFRIEYMNPVNIDVAGRGRDELVGRRVLDLYPAMAPLLATYVDVVQTGRPAAIDELPYEDVIDGRPVTGFYAMQVTKFGDGVIISARDVSAERRDRARLEAAVARLDAAQRLAHLGIWEVTEDGRVSFTDELLRIFGLEPGTSLPALHEAIEAFVAPTDQDVLADLITQAISEGRPFTRDLHIRRVDGEERIVQIYGAVHDEDPRLWGTGQDVTEQRRADEALREAAVALAEERASVALLQSAVLPVLPSIDGVDLAAVYLPAGAEAKVGGDWFDALTLPDGRLYVAVGDVAGHGLAAASAMAQARNALRGCAFSGLGPAAMCTVVSELYRATNPDSFATCLIGVLAAGRSSMQWCSAGHPPPIRRDATGRVEGLAVGPGPPLGVGTDYREFVVPVAAGDCFVLYTDGLVERPGELLDVGFERLQAAVESAADEAAEPLCRHLVEAMAVADGGRDDVCVLAVRAG